MAAAASDSAAVVTPVSTRASSSSALTSRILSIRVSTITIPPRSATVAAHRFEPAPRGTTGTRRAVASLRIAATSSAVRGQTTPSGTARNAGVASRA